MKVFACLLLVGFFVGTALAAVESTQGVYLPTSFSSNVQLFISASGHATNYYGTLYYDYAKLRRRLTVQDQFSRTIDALARFDLEKQYQISDGHCSVSYISRNEADWFGWVASAQSVGTFQVNGQSCNMFQLQAQNSVLSCCVVNGNLPILLRFQTGPTDTQYVFNNVHVGAQPEALFQIPSMCPRSNNFNTVNSIDNAEFFRPTIIKVEN